MQKRGGMQKKSERRKNCYVGVKLSRRKMTVKNIMWPSLCQWMSLEFCPFQLINIDIMIPLGCGGRDGKSQKVCHAPEG